ncbi:hypothetical protein GF406_02475 [candidate division KSB1 bacterium]|nr:hypothetical protein [candidate division KSB1 bacterium]
MKTIAFFAVPEVPLQLQFKDAIDSRSKALYILSQIVRLWSALLPYAHFGENMHQGKIFRRKYG